MFIREEMQSLMENLIHSADFKTIYWLLMMQLWRSASFHQRPCSAVEQNDINNMTVWPKNDDFTMGIVTLNSATKKSVSGISTESQGGSDPLRCDLRKLQIFLKAS